MAKKETLTLEVKSNIKSVTQDTDKMAGSLGDVNQEAQDSIGNFNIMGVSLNGVKAAFGKIIPIAKTMFSTIKAGILSTGIGALVLAFGALMTWFTKTKVGAEALEKVFAGIGAAVSVVIDRISSLASVAKALFSGNVKGALTGLKNAFTGIGDEIRADVTAAIQLEGRLQSLRDSERDFNKVRAQTRQDIQKARLEALDESKSAEERLASLQRANDLELETTKSSITLQKEKIAIQGEQMSLSENLADDLDVLSGLEVGLIDLQTQSFQTRKRLATEMETLTNEIAAKEKAKADERRAKNKAAHAARMKEIEEEKKAELERIIAVEKSELGLQNDITLLQIEGAMDKEAELLHIQLLAEKASIEAMDISNEDKLKLMELFWDKEDLLEQQHMDKVAKMKEVAAEKTVDIRIAEFQKVADAQLKIRDANLNNISAGISLVKSLAGENKEIMAGAIIAENAMGIAKTIINTQASNATTIAQGAALAIPTAGASVAAASGLVASNNIAAGLSIAASVAAAAQGLSALGKGGATGGRNPSTSGGNDSGTPAPEMMSGAFELTGGVEADPLQAFVVSDDITDSQNGLAVIRRRATI